MRNLKGWLSFVAVVACAVAVALGAPEGGPKHALTEREARDVFWTIARAEPEMRAAAARSFPGDSWSQDDDFHALEQTRARDLATARHAGLGDVLRAIDDGMRGRWDGPASASMNPKVPPCRPRLDY